MNSLDRELRHQLDGYRNEGLLRQLRTVEAVHSGAITLHGRDFLNFSSNDYLGLSRHPELVEAAKKAAADWGAGSRASRLISGSLAVHHHLEERLAAWKQTEAALVFGSGYSTALGIIPALTGANDLILVDRLVHASCLDGARLSPATLRIFRHNDLDHLEQLLKRSHHQTMQSGTNSRRIWIIAESIYSMDGDGVPLRPLVALKEKYGAWLILDEAHATGLFGIRRTGVAEAEEVAEHVEVQMGTLGKALGGSGGYVCGSRILVDYLINRARSFVFSTAPTPSSSASAMAAIRIIESSEGKERAERTWQMAQHLNAILNHRRGSADVASSAILPLRIGGVDQAMKLAADLMDAGIYVPAIRYPTVPRGEARLRFTANADQTSDQMDQLVRALGISHQG